MESQTRHTFDGLGRETEARLMAGDGDGGTTLAVTKTIHGGDRTTVIPPEGGTATTTLSDARGQLTELRQHRQPSAGAPFDATTYAYTPRGQLSAVTDPAGNQWTYTYDQLGRQISTTDPDAGTSTTVYDDRGQVVSTTNARDVTLAYSYDGLGRKIELREGGPAGALRAEWLYDMVPGAKGQLARSTRWENGNAYIQQADAYDHLYRMTRSRTTIPASEGPLAGTYRSATGFLAPGLVGGVDYPAAGSLPAQGAVFTYEDHTLRLLTTSGVEGLRADATYSLTGKPLQFELGYGNGKKMWATNTYEWGTQRLQTARVDRLDQPGVDRHETYSYDAIGNVRSIADVSRTGTDVQCFTYDYLRRLTDAWTQATETCASSGTAATIGGPAPYHHSYTYDAVGNRLTETLHEQDITRAYGYSEAQPHTVTEIVQDAPGIRSLEEYAYDATGNTVSRQLGGDTQTLTWNPEGRVESVTNADGSTASYLYDTAGSRLIGRTDTETTLYLGHTEITVPTGSTTPSATRYIDVGGGHQAVMDDDGTVSFTLADHHGTGHLAIDAATQDITQRRTLPFGGIRGADPTDAWPGTRAFVGGTKDVATGLTHIGAREYDPALGRFISLDPIMDLTDPQQIHGYTYANNNPLAFSDPTGLFLSGVRDSVKNVVNSARSVARSVGSPSGVRAIGTPPVTGTAPAGRLSPPASTATNALWTPSSTNGVSQTSTADRELGKLKDAGEQAAKNAWGFLRSLVVPDVEPVKECASAPGKTAPCGSAVMEFAPWGKFVKSLRKTADELVGAIKGGKRCHSFLPGTHVLMADGTSKPIEEVVIGDQLLATDPETGETEARTVTAEILGQGEKNLVSLTIDDTTIVATDHHPFWVPDLSEWVDATDLTPGTWLRTSAGTLVQVTAIHRWAQPATVHNLTIADTHTYYVLAGETPVLVHNSGPCDPPLKDLHPRSSLDKSSLDFWSKQDTEDIVFSLRPGAKEALRVKPDGTIANGNTRVTVLRDRGYDVDSLPREPYGSSRPMTDEDFWNMNQ